MCGQKWVPMKRGREIECTWNKTEKLRTGLSGDGRRRMEKKDK